MKPRRQLTIKRVPGIIRCALVPRWEPTQKQVVVAIRTVVILAAVVLILTGIGYAYEITLWDWLQLLIVPAVLAGGGIWFNWAQKEREQALADERAQDAALQAYLDHMAQLLIDQPLRRAQPGDNLSLVARARTVTVLGRLDGFRKGSVLQFLHESGLIEKEQPVIDLGGAPLSGASLSEIHLSGANLNGTNLSNAELVGADLSEANLKSAHLRGADLTFARLRDASLSLAHLDDANLAFAQLSAADLNGAYLSNANLEGAQLVDANLIGANLASTRLNGATLTFADLSDADLSEADLVGADLNCTNLTGANLSGAEGLTQEQIQEAIGNQTTKLPDNLQRPEAWSKDMGKQPNEE